MIQEVSTEDFKANLRGPIIQPEDESYEETREAYNAMMSKAGGRTEETLLRHVQAFAEGDQDSLMADYCEDAVLLTPEGVFRGSREIGAFFGAFFERFLVDFPRSTLELSRRIAERTIAYAVWTRRSERLDIPFATDTLVVREGKILTQTFTARMDPK